MGLAKLADTWILYKLQRARLKSNGGFASNEVFKKSIATISFP